MAGPAIKKGDPFKIAKLPKPLQALANMFFPPDDPLGGLSPTPLISIYKDALGVPSKLLRQRGTQEFLKSARDTDINGIPDAAELLAEKYPRVSAHMRLEKDPSYALPMMARVKGHHGKVTAPQTVFLSEDQPFPLHVLGHEATHVVQNLGNPRSLELYNKANQAKHIGYMRNPLERSAIWKGYDLEPLTSQYSMDVAERPKESAISALKKLGIR